MNDMSLKPISLCRQVIEVYNLKISEKFNHIKKLETFWKKVLQGRLVSPKSNIYYKFSLKSFVSYDK